jgi:hypothetical protein
VEESGHRLLQSIKPVLEPPCVDQGLTPRGKGPGDHLAMTALDDRAQQLVGVFAVGV